MSRRLLTLALAALAALAVAAPGGAGPRPARGQLAREQGRRRPRAVDGELPLRRARRGQLRRGGGLRRRRPARRRRRGLPARRRRQADRRAAEGAPPARLLHRHLPRRLRRQPPGLRGLVFSIGAAGAAPGKSVADLLAGESAGPVTETAFGVARGASYLAIALGLGGLIFLLAIWGPALTASAGAGGEWPAAASAFARRARVLLATAVGLGVAFGLAGIVLQGATAAGTSFSSALDPGVIHEVLGTRFGLIWALRCGAWLLLGTVLMAGAGTSSVTVLQPVAVGADGYAPSLASRPATIAALALPAAFLAVSPALAGHASTERPVAALAPLDVVHVLATSAWIGGLVMALLVVPAATRRLIPGDRSRLLAALLLRFSPLALACVVALAATGATMALLEMGGIAPLFDTPFGRAVLIKVCLLAALVVLGAVNRRQVVPALARLAGEGTAPGGAGRLLQRTLRAEVALVVCVLGVTAALVTRRRRRPRPARSRPRGACGRSSCRP